MNVITMKKEINKNPIDDFDYLKYIDQNYIQVEGNNLDTQFLTEYLRLNRIIQCLKEARLRLNEAYGECFYVIADDNDELKKQIYSLNNPLGVQIHSLENLQQKRREAFERMNIKLTVSLSEPTED